MGAPDPTRTPSVDRLARSLAPTGLPHRLLVEVAREAVASGRVSDAPALADGLRRTLLRPVVNATGVLLHTNLGRAPLALTTLPGAVNLELELDSGQRGRRADGVNRLLGSLVGAEATHVVNNGAAALLLALAATCAGRDVVVSRGESVEIGGGFRIPEVLTQSGARLVDVGTTNRTRRSDYEAAIDDPATDVAAILRVHPSNFSVQGFTASVPIEAVVDLGVPVIVDVGSGLVDAGCPGLGLPPPAWLRGEPAVRQTLAAGAALVTFSGDKLFAGPQAGVIAGDRQLVERCATHPLARALRPGRHVLGAMQDVALAHLDDRATSLPFWRQATASLASLAERASVIVEAVRGASGGSELAIVSSDSVPGAGSAPDAVIPSVAVALEGDRSAALRAGDPPVVARVTEGRTLCDLRSVEPEEDEHLVRALVEVLR